MLLKKKGVTIEVTHPTDIATYKRLGYSEVTKAKEQKSAKSAPSQAVSDDRESGQEVDND